MLKSLSRNGIFINENIATKKERGADLAHLSSKDDKDGKSVKEDIGHSYNERLFYFQRKKKQIMFKHINYTILQKYQ